MALSIAAILSRVVSTHRGATPTRVVAPTRRNTDAVVISNSLAAAQTGGAVQHLDHGRSVEESTAELALGDLAIGRLLSRTA